MLRYPFNSKCLKSPSSQGMLQKWASWFRASHVVLEMVLGQVLEYILGQRVFPYPCPGIWGVCWWGKSLCAKGWSYLSLCIHWIGMKLNYSKNISLEMHMIIQGKSYSIQLCLFFWPIIEHYLIYLPHTLLWHTFPLELKTFLKEPWVFRKRNWINLENV